MGRSQESYHKKMVRQTKEKKRKDKEKRKAERKEGKSGGGLDDMIAYVDADGNIVDTPPEPRKKDDIELEDIEVSVPKRDPDFAGDQIREGRLNSFNDSKGFGFIRDSDTGDDVFVHINEFMDEINEGDRVSFELSHGPKGHFAIKVKRI